MDLRQIARGAAGHEQQPYERLRLRDLIRLAQNIRDESQSLRAEARLLKGQLASIRAEFSDGRLDRRLRIECHAGSRRTSGQ
jgi:hypothetical protein